MSLPSWECFPPWGDRVSHGYRWDCEAKEFVSLCGRRTVPDSEQDPRWPYLRKHGGWKAEQPPADDWYGFCQKCCRKAEIRMTPPKKPGRPPLDEAKQSRGVRVNLTAAQVVDLDAKRGTVPRSEFLARCAGLVRE